LCDEHKREIADPLEKRIAERELQLVSALTEELLASCSFTFSVQDDDAPYLIVDGPQDIIEHGPNYFYLRGDLAEQFQKSRTRKLPYRLTDNEIRDEGILSLLMGPIVDDLSALEWHKTFYGTSYLFDSAFQISTACKVNSSTYKADSSAFNSAAQHYLPVVHGSDLESVVKLRDQEEEAFAVYRDKMHSLLKETDNWSQDELSEIFRDRVLPEINRITKKVEDWKTKQRNALSDSVLFGTGAVVIGLYSGVLPPNIGELVAAFGGLRAVSDTLNQYNQTLKESQEARSDDFYFLWKLNQ
jgi:hypothetical protein